MARRTIPVRSSPSGGVAPGMRIGSLGAPAAGEAAAAQATLALGPPVVRQGLTPAGGLTVEVGDRFMTHMVAHEEAGPSGRPVYTGCVARPALR